MDFSIIFPSRERVQLLATMIDSIHNCTADISKVEVLVGIDDDDVETHAAIPWFQKDYPFAKLCSRTRSHMLNNDYINWLAGTSTGRFLIICNDDARFITKGWDSLIMPKLENYLVNKPDGVVYGYIHDTLIDRLGMQYCCFPLVSRKAYQALGWAMPPHFPSWGADIACWQVYGAVGRILDLSVMTIEHVSYHSNKRARDHISHHVERIARYHKAGHDMPAYINALRNCIQRGGE